MSARRSRIRPERSVGPASAIRTVGPLQKGEIIAAVKEAPWLRDHSG